MQRAPRQHRRRRAYGSAAPRQQAGSRRVAGSFSRAALLALGSTCLFLALPGEVALAQAPAPAGDAGASTRAEAPVAGGPDRAGEAAGRQRATDEIVRSTEEEARFVAGDVWSFFLAELPRLLVAIAALILAWALFRTTRWALRRLVPGWSRANAFTALVGFGIWVFAGGVACSIIAGDIRGILGSVGLVGLALSWALRTPIESVTGWLLNSFRGYYRVGDRIAVGSLQGDVHRIDVLTTTLWEVGGAGRGPVQAEQPTGRTITIPNREILTGAMVNFSRDLPWLWDEIEITVASESDLALAARTALRAAEEAVGEKMRAPAIRYGEILRAHGLEQQLPDRPEVFLAPATSWMIVTVRYLVPTLERRRWKSELTLRITEAMQAPGVAARVFPGYPRTQWQRLDAKGRPQD